MRRNQLLLGLPAILTVFVSVTTVSWGQNVENKKLLKTADEWVAPLRSAAAGADKMVVVGNKFEVTGEAKVKELLDLVTIDAKNSDFICLCDGSYHIQFYKGDKLVLSLGWHHSIALRWHRGQWPADAVLTEKSQLAIPAWFQKQGFPALARERETKLAAEREERERRDRFRHHFPESVKDMKDGKEVAAAVCRAFGTFRDYHQSWSSYTTAESAALSAVAMVSGEDFLAALVALKDDRAGLLGAARFFFWDGFCNKIPRQAQAEWYVRLAEISLTDAWDGNKDLVMRRLSRTKIPQVEALLADVFEGKVGKEMGARSKYKQEPGIRAGAALALALLGKGRPQAELENALAKSTVKPDVAAFEICLALQGDPKRLRKDHFKLESFSIGYAGLEVIERHKGEGPLMEILIESAMHHPWAAVADEALKTFQRVTGLVLDRNEIEDWWAIKQGRQPKTKLILQCSKAALVLGDNTKPQRCAKFSPDGKWIAAGNDGKTATIWSATTGKVVTVLEGHSETVMDLAFSPDVKRLVTASWDDTLKVWDTNTGKELMTLRGHKRQVMGVAISRDGKLIASASHDGTVKVWDTETGAEKFTYRGHATGVQSAAFSADGRRIASTSHDGVIKVWNALSGENVFALKCANGWFRGVTFSPNGKYLAASGGKANAVTVWDADTGKEVFTTESQLDWPTDPAFSADSSLLAVGCKRKTVSIWEMATRKEKLTFKAHTGDVGSVAFSVDGKRMVTASNDQTVKVWNLEDLP